MKRAFTVIELIIVVAILLILMGMLIPVVTGARARAKKKLTATEIGGICLALERYFADTGEYPPDNSDYGSWGEELSPGGTDPCVSPFAGSLYFYLCGPDGNGLQLPWDPRVYGPYIAFKEKRLRMWEGVTVVVDGWGNPYIYEEHRSLFGTKAATRMNPFERDQLAAKKRAHNKMSYDLFSTGPDGKLDVSRHDIIDNDADGTEDEEDEVLNPGDDRPDDITNW